MESTFIVKSRTKPDLKKKFLNELHTPFFPYFDTQHLICVLLFLGVVPGGPKTLKKLMISKKNSTRVCKKNF